MEPIIGLIAIVAILYVTYHRTFAKVIVAEYEAGLLYKNGRFTAKLAPGAHRVCRLWSEIKNVDLRKLQAVIQGQELLSADNVGLKMSLVVNYRIADPAKALHTVPSYYAAIYVAAQLALREKVAALKIDDLLAGRLGFGPELVAKITPEAESIGLTVLEVAVRDVMFPGELKKIFAEVVRAQKEGQAALERARGESAALRNLANAAKLLENNPALMNLRILQALGATTGGSGHSLVLGVPQGLVPLPTTPPSTKPSDAPRPGDAPAS